MQPVELRLKEKIDELTELARNNNTWKIATYALGYILMENEPYKIEKLQRSFSSIQDLTRQFVELESEPQKLIEVADQLIKDENTLRDEFAGWLVSKDIPYNKFGNHQ